MPTLRSTPVLLLGAVVAQSVGATDVDLSQAQVQKTMFGTFHIDGVLVSGISQPFGADLVWDSVNNVFVPQNVTPEAGPVVCAFDIPSANGITGTLAINREANALQLVVTGFSGASFDYHGLSLQGLFADGSMATVLFANTPSGVTGQTVSSDPNDPYAVYVGYGGQNGALATEAALLMGDQGWNGLAPNIVYGARYTATLTVAPNLDPTAAFNYAGPLYITYAITPGAYNTIQC